MSTDNQLDTPNPTFTSEQIGQLDEFQKRLFNLENETTIATSVLKTVKAESQRAAKDKAYQEELLAEIVKKISIARDSLNELEIKIGVKTTELNNLVEQIREQYVSHETKSNELKEREEKIIKEEKVLVLKEKKITESNQHLSSHIETHNQKVAKLKEVIATF